MKFEVTVAMEELGVYDGVVQALKVLLDKVGELADKGQMSNMTLNETIFLALNPNGPDRRVMNFYQAREFAYEIGVLSHTPGTGTQFHYNVAEPDSRIIQQAFDKAMSENLRGMAKQITSSISQTLKQANMVIGQAVSDRH